MDFSEEDLKKSATLAKLNLSAREVTLIGDQLHKFIKYAEVINGLDLDSVEPFVSPYVEDARLRSDIMQDSIEPSEALKNRPDENSSSDNNYFQVPIILDDPES